MTDIVQARLNEPNDIARMAPWDLDFRQISAGAGTSEVTVRAGQSVTALSLRMDCAVHQLGEAPPGLVTIGLSRPGGLVSWRGVNAPETAMVCFGSGHEFDGVSAAGFEATTLSISKADLRAMALDFGLDDPLDALSVGVFDTAALPGPAALMARKAAAFMGAAAGTDLGEIEDDLGLAFLLAMSTRPTSQATPAGRLRDRAVARALDVLDARADDPPSVRDLCRLSGASWPTLYRGFADRFGIGPKRYLLNLRLNRARSDLLVADRLATVASVANRWGFWHMGQFAGDYQKLFNRRPSQDLRALH